MTVISRSAEPVRSLARVGGTYRQQGMYRNLVIALPFVLFESFGRSLVFFSSIADDFQSQQLQFFFFFLNLSFAITSPVPLIPCSSHPEDHQPLIAARSKCSGRARWGTAEVLDGSCAVAHSSRKNVPKNPNTKNEARVVATAVRGKV